MSQTTINFTWQIGGAPTDATSVLLSDPTAAYGVRRTDTNALVVAAGTALTRDATGVYHYQFADPAAGLTYEYWLAVVYGGATYRLHRTVAGPGATTLASYLGLADADALAAALPALGAWPNASAAAKTAALAQATLDLDTGMRYQGRRYDNSQPLEFPRVAYEAAARVRNVGSIPMPVIAPAYGEILWDWDATLQAAVVPQNVKLACLYQADSILAGNRDERLSEQHDGVSQQSNSGMQEIYRARNQAPGLDTGLCRRAYQLLQNYKLRAGRLL